MDRRGLEVRDVLEGLDLQHAVLVGGSMGANTIWSYVAQCGTERLATADLPVLFVAGQDSEFWPASRAAARAVLAPMGDSIVLVDDGHAANIEQPKASNEALLGFLRAA